MARAIGRTMTVERVDTGVLCTLGDDGAFILFDNLAFAASFANAILRVCMFERPQRILIDEHGCVIALPEEGIETLAGPIAAPDFDGTEDGTGEPPC